MTPLGNKKISLRNTQAIQLITVKDLIRSLIVSYIRTRVMQYIKLMKANIQLAKISWEVFCKKVCILLTLLIGTTCDRWLQIIIILLEIRRALMSYSILTEWLIMSTSKIFISMILTKLFSFSWINRYSITSIREIAKTLSCL